MAGGPNALVAMLVRDLPEPQLLQAPDPHPAPDAAAYSADSAMTRLESDAESARQGVDELVRLAREREPQP